MNRISAIELQKRLDAGEKINIIDVREPAEYQDLNMGVPLLPLGEIMHEQIDSIAHLKEEELVIHCKSGMRSMQACLKLEQLGFKNTVNLESGIMAWSQLA